MPRRMVGPGRIGQDYRTWGPQSAPREVARFSDDVRDDGRHRDFSQGDHHGKPYKKKRRESFLGELFDF